MVCFAAVRGLKPTATVVVSLRETGTRCPIFRARSSSCARWRCIPAAQSWSSTLRWETCRPRPGVFTPFGVALLHGDRAMNELYDAIVLGGGPGGATAGLLLARAGWRVAIIEKARFPRRK